MTQVLEKIGVGERNRTAVISLEDFRYPSTFNGDFGKAAQNGALNLQKKPRLSKRRTGSEPPEK
jgi:hypothetical protein